MSVSATRGASGEVVAVALGYAAGSALVLLLLAYGGRRVLDRLRAAGRGPAVQRALGVVLVATAVAVATDLDVRFQTALANDFPRSSSTRPSRSSARAPSRTGSRACAAPPASPRREADARRHRPHAGLPVLGRAPDFTGNQRWFNTRAGPARPRAAARAGGARRLLDLHLHQLHPHAALRARLGRPLPQARAHDRRRPHAGVRVRARRRQRRARDRPEPAALSGRPGQRVRHLERLGQPVLARQVPDRRARARALRALRRGRLRQDRVGDPRAAGRGRRSHLGATAARTWRRPRRDWRPPRPTSTTSAPRTSTRPCGPGVGSYAAPKELEPVHFALRRHLGRLGRVGNGGARREHPRARDRAQGVPRARHERRPAARRAGAARREARFPTRTPART